ncbi:MAG: hypothetical protein HoeaKO_28290 [Hoeflea alexandrii]
MTQSGYSTDLFKGKTVVVTGAGRGIGLSVAQAFAEHGARVIAHSGRSGSAKVFAESPIEPVEADFLDAPSFTLGPPEGVNARDYALGMVHES